MVMPSPSWPSSLPYISSSGDTAASSTSMTRLDFSSTVEVSSSWPPVMTPMNSSRPQAKGSTRAMPRDAGAIACGRHDD